MDLMDFVFVISAAGMLHKAWHDGSISSDTRARLEATATYDGSWTVPNILTCRLCSVSYFVGFTLCIWYAAQFVSGLPLVWDSPLSSLLSGVTWCIQMLAYIVRLVVLSLAGGFIVLQLNVRLEGFGHTKTAGGNTTAAANYEHADADAPDRHSEGG